MTGRTPHLKFPRLLLRPQGTLFHLSLPRIRTVIVFCLLSFVAVRGHAAESATACPSLQSYYPTDDSSWPRVVQQLTPLLSECLDSAEYFALLGAAQMNSGQITEAQESLERALLIDPEHGAASVDYAQVLYITGQLFPALEVNRALLARSDLPPELARALQARQQEWDAQTRAKGLTAEVSAGYDNNLNGGPSSRDFTLTLSGESVSLTLAPESQPVSGAYLNLQLSGFYRRVQAERSHDLVFALRNRRSEHSASELVQFDWRYAQSLSTRRYRWDLVAGTSHLLYGGNPLYTVTEARARMNRGGSGCQPQYELAAQHQLYHGQSFMRGIEASVTGGVYCDFGSGTSVAGFDLGPLANIALKEVRPGGDRRGWRLRLSWQFKLGEGLVNSQFSYAQLNDQTGYSELLANGAKREINNRYLRIQYSRVLLGDLTLLAGLNHQTQGSNLLPFESNGTAFDLGLRLVF